MSSVTDKANVLLRLAELQGAHLSQDQLVATLNELDPKDDARTTLARLSRELNRLKIHHVATPTGEALPLLSIDASDNWVVVRAVQEDHWLVELPAEGLSVRSEKSVAKLPDGAMCFACDFTREEGDGEKPVLRLIKKEILKQRPELIEIISASVALNILAVAVSLYTMQVYDRVIPTGATATLYTLTVGVLVAVTLEFLGRTIRSRQRQKLSDRVDERMARATMGRLAGVRFDALPVRSGAEAQRLRGYEIVRSCLISAGVGALIDLPMAISLLVLVAVIAGWLALIPAGALLILLVTSLIMRRRAEAEAVKGSEAQSRKTGILVEFFEGAEVIKSIGADWRVIARWIEAAKTGRMVESRVHLLSERLQALTATIQQGAHVALIACGALLVAQGHLSMGALIACTMLMGRIIAPAAALPGLVMQWGRMRSAILDLEELWRLPQDQLPHAVPLKPSEITGALGVENISLQRDGRPVLALDNLKISAGERIGIVGTVGAGKTTLLRLLAGLYQPDNGRVTLDGLDLTQIDKTVRAKAIGYIPQETRLFSGTLRDNLLLRQASYDDDILLAACRRTGLFDSAIATHPRGLDRPITEGGAGMSGGQRQLVHLTRVMLENPAVWILDEPTAAMDQPLEARFIELLRKEASEKGTTLILATHKPQLLGLTDRLLVIANGQVRLDGPRTEVLERLRQVARVA